MIANERQYRITKGQLAKLRDAVGAFDMDEAESRLQSRELAGAETNAMKSEVDALTEDVREYEALKSGLIRNFVATSIEELPRILIQARIAKGLTQKDLADILGLREQQIQRYESEKYLSTSLRRVADVAGALDLSLSKVAEFQTSPENQPVELDWSMFPAREMYKRGWFEGFTGSLPAALAEAKSLVEQFVRSVRNRPALSFHRKRVRAGSTVDLYALMAWECRTLHLAWQSPPRAMFDRERITDRWLCDTVRLSNLGDGPAHVSERLNKVGIAFVVEPHLPGTHLDGAALLDKGMPIVAVTLRYDRLDNFWFVLMHELVHIVKHLRKGKTEDIFDDLEADADDMERQTDEDARELLIPDDAWETALARYLRTPKSVQSLALELGISASVIAGRIRFEADNYILLRNMVGQGEVRKYFTEVHFGQ